MLLGFGEFRIDTASAELRGPGGAVPIEPKVYDMLVLLAENPGRLVTREEMIEQVWGGRIVSDSAVSTVLKNVRRAIGDDGVSQRFLKTVHGRGHRFTAEVEVLRPASVAVAGEAVTPPVAAAGGQPTLAVLPFRAYGSDPRLETLADAIPAEIISALSRLRWLRVLARESCFRFRAAAVNLEAVKSVLGAGYALSGTLEVSGRRLSVGIDLTDTRTRAVLWSDRLAGNDDDVHEIRHQIVEEVISALDLQIPINEAARARLMTSESLDAWGAYHLGMAHAFRFSRRDNEIATDLFRRAVQLDPGFAGAYAGLSFTSFQDAFMGFEPDRASAVRAARAAAERSVELDPLDPQANSAMGRLGLLEGIGTGWSEWMDRSVALSPSYAKGHYSRALLQACAGDAIASRDGVNRAEHLSPLDPMMGPMLITHAITFVLEGNLDAAAEFSRRGAAVARHHAVAHMAAAAFNLMAGRRDDAITLARSVLARRPDISITVFARALPVADHAFTRQVHGALRELGFRG